MHNIIPIVMAICYNTALWFQFWIRRYFALETVRQTSADGMIALITSKATYFLGHAKPKEPVLQVNHKDLIHARKGMSGEPQDLVGLPHKMALWVVKYCNTTS